MIPLVAVLGRGHDASPVERALAYELGSGLASHGLSLVCGGRGGVMEAACRGHREARPASASCLCVGILPGYDPAQANPHVDIAIPTGLGLARNVLVVSSAAVVVAVGGASGTLSEMALAWQLGKPVLALGPGWAGELAGASLDDRRTDIVVPCASPEEALAQVLGVISR